MATAIAEQELLMRVRVDAAEAIRNMEGVAGKIKGVSDQAANSAKGFSSMQRGVQGASYQITDFIVQVQGGQSALRAFGQQAPQLLAGFAGWGAALGLAASALSVFVESTDIFLSKADEIKRANEGAVNGMKLLKEAHRGLGDDTVGAINNWAKAWKAASGEVRKELELNLSLTLQVMKAEQLLLKGREDVDKSIAKGTTKEFWYGGLTQGESSIKERQAALQRLNRGNQLTDDIAAMEKFAKNPSSPLLKTNSEIEGAGKKQLSEYEKALSSLNAKNKELSETTRILSNAQNDYLSGINKVTDSEKAKLKLDEDIKNNVVQYSEAQKKNLYTVLETNIAMEKKNILQTEANKAITNARTALDVYNDEVEKNKLLLEKGLITQGVYNDAMEKASKTVAAADPMIMGITSSISSFFTSATIGAQSFGSALTNLAVDLSKVVYQVIVLEPLVKSLRQAMVSSGWFSIKTGQGAGVNPLNADGYTAGGESVASANGNVFNGSISGGSSNVIPFAIGGIVSRPTYFPMGNGKRGLAGEAGSEAIIPLRRGADGKLGVTASGMGSGGTVVNIFNQGNDTVETKTRQDSNGSEVIDVYIKKAVADGIANGQFDKAFGSTYGLKRTGTR